jgi:H+/Cl- antiporter ClcA
MHEGYIPQPMDAFVLGAFAAFYGSNLIRALPWPEAWKQRKPLACPLCLAGWLCIVGWLLGTHWLIAAAAAGGALLLEEIRDRLKGASWGLPPS